MSHARLLAATFFLVAPPAAHAQQQPPPTGTRLVAGVGAAAIKGSNPTGSSVRGPGAPLDAQGAFGVMLGFEHRVARRLSMLESASYEWFAGGAAPDASYRIRRLSFGAAPHLRIGTVPFLRQHPTEAEFYFATPVGLGFASRTPPPRRAISEQIDNGAGFYVGATLGATWMEDWWGLRFEMGYRLNRSSERSVVTASDGSVPPAVDERTYTDHQLVFTFAALLGFY